MSSTLLRELVQFVNALEQVQNELLALFTEKRQALDAFRPRDLEALSAREGELTARLQALVAMRTRLLEDGRRQGFQVSNLRELSGAIGRTVADGRLRAALQLLDSRVVQAQARTARLQQAAWTHWIVSHRCYTHYAELLDMIAHGGKPAPTYGDNPGAAPGGALLDAAA